MIPLILVSNTARKTETYISRLLKEQKDKTYKVLRYKPEKSVLTIDQIREIQTQAVRLKDCMIVVYDFDTAKVESQNALLKTLEESSENVVFILVVKSTGKILPTILSRCRVVGLVNDDTRGSKDFDIFSYTSSEEAMAKASTMTKIQQSKAIDSIIYSLRDKMSTTETASAKKYADNIVYALDVRKAITENNVNSEYGLDQVIIDVLS